MTRQVNALQVAVLLIAVVALLNLAASPLLGQEADAPAEVAPTESGAPAETIAEEPAQTVTEPDRDNWMGGVDAWFGKWLVKPLGTVLMYDFGTGRLFESEHERIPFVVAWLFVGALFFTIRMGFINVRAFWHALRLTKGDYDLPGDHGEVSHFQALASALSATVGLGNIAGVAIAVSIGGPGAVFWMIIAGLVGMTSKFTECTLGQMYRKIDPDGRVSGGPMHYLYDGLAERGLAPLGKVLAVLFTILCIGASFGGGCAFQVVQSLGVLRNKIPLLEPNAQPWIYGVVMAVMVGIVIIGGIRRIGATAEKIVPAMCGVYVLAALYIIGVHWRDIPWAFGTILDGAFTGAGAAGGMVGVLVTGIQRAAFSNEAGVGSAAIAHSAARTDEPVSEGIVALLEPFIDTVVICTMTGLVIVITGVYDAQRYPEFAVLVQRNQGAQLTGMAFDTVINGFSWILMVAVVLFAYSTMISWSYYGERCWSLLLGERWSIVYKILFLAFVVLGSIVTATNILDFSDLMILAMAVPNILGMYILSAKVRRALDVYWHNYKSGELVVVKRDGGPAA
jgi:AGCS family alanine or glycine:cation symporter